MIPLLQMYLSARGPECVAFKRALNEMIIKSGLRKHRVGSYSRDKIEIASVIKLLDSILEMEKRFAGKAEIRRLIVVGGIDILVSLERPPRSTKGRSV